MKIDSIEVMRRVFLQMTGQVAPMDEEFMGERPPSMELVEKFREFTFQYGAVIHETIRAMKVVDFAGATNCTDEADEKAWRGILRAGLGDCEFRVRGEIVVGPAASSVRFAVPVPEQLYGGLSLATVRSVFADLIKTKVVDKLFGKESLDGIQEYFNVDPKDGATRKLRFKWTPEAVDGCEGFVKGEGPVVNPGPDGSEGK